MTQKDKEIKEKITEILNTDLLDIIEAYLENQGYDDLFEGDTFIQDLIREVLEDYGMNVNELDY